MDFFYFMCMCNYTCISIYVHHVHSWSPQKPEDGIRSHGTRITGSYESSDMGPGNLNPGSLQEH